MSTYSDLNYIKPSLGGMIYDGEAIYQSLFSIIGTKRGERVFRPSYGLSLESYLFEPCDELTARSILYEITSIISLEPRITFDLSKSTVTPVPNEHLFLIELVFTIQGFGTTEKTLNLVLNQRG